MLMIRSTILTAVIGSAILTTACDQASTHQEKVTGARTEANDKIFEAQREGDRTMQHTKREENKKVAAAEADFAKVREDYRHQITQNLAELDRRMVSLETELAESTGDVRDRLEGTLKKLRTRREAFGKQYKSLESSSGAAWDQTKAWLDKEWTEIEALFESA